MLRLNRQSDHIDGHIWVTFWYLSDINVGHMKYTSSLHTYDVDRAALEAVRWSDILPYQWSTKQNKQNVHLRDTFLVLE